MKKLGRYDREAESVSQKGETKGLKKKRQTEHKQKDRDRYCYRKHEGMTRLGFEPPTSLAAGG